MNTIHFRATLILAAAAASVSATGCKDPTGADAALIAAARIGDAYYTSGSTFDLQAETLGERVATLRFVDCSDGIWIEDHTHVSDDCRLDDGDSNFLPTGTAVFTVEGVDPLERLAARRVIEGEFTEAGDPVTELIHLVRVGITAPTG